MELRLEEEETEEKKTTVLPIFLLSGMAQQVSVIEHVTLVTITGTTILVPSKSNHCNKQVLQIQALLAACHAPAGEHNRSPKVPYVF